MNYSPGIKKMHSSGGCFHQTMNLLPRYPEKKVSQNRHFVTGGIKARKEGYAAPGMDAVPDDWYTG